MTALDIITLEDAKAHLVVDFDDDDAAIKRAINTAVSWVEQYTCYRLYQRAETVDTTGCQMEIYTYPVTVDDVLNENGDSVQHKVTKRSLKILVSAPADCTINMTVGYVSLEALEADKPQLIDACYKLITYLYENKDAYSMGLPIDIQGIINQLRRGLF